MLAGTVYLALLGAEGLERVAALSMQRTEQLSHVLTSIPGARRLFGRAGFHEFVLGLDRARGARAGRVKRARHRGRARFVDYYPELGPALLLCATETKTAADIDSYGRALNDVLRAARAA